MIIHKGERTMILSSGFDAISENSGNNLPLLSKFYI
jgi:hypothetical protein